MERVWNSVGIWAFGPNATRFMPSGYHQDTVDENMPAKVQRVVDGLGDLVDGYEFHYPNEVDEGNVDAVTKALGQADIYALALGLRNKNANLRVHLLSMA